MRVTVTRDYDTDAGKRVKADATVDLPRGEATNLLHLGLARKAEDAAPAPKQKEAN